MMDDETLTIACENLRSAIKRTKQLDAQPIAHARMVRKGATMYSVRRDGAEAADMRRLDYLLYGKR